MDLDNSSPPTPGGGCFVTAIVLAMTVLSLVVSFVAVT